MQVENLLSEQFPATNKMHLSCPSIHDGNTDFPRGRMFSEAVGLRGEVITNLAPLQ